MRKARRGEAAAWMDRHLCRNDFDCECVIWPFATNGNGYGKLHRRYTHDVVCRKFHGERPEGMQVAHSCGNRLCCNPNHLRWASPIENTREKVRHGTQKMGESIPFSKLTNSQVRVIYSDDRRYTVIAKDYDITSACVRAIKMGRSWRHVTGGADVTKGQLRGSDIFKAKLTESQALEIYNDCRVQAEIALDYGIHGVTVSKIKTGKTWSHVTGHRKAS